MPANAAFRSQFTCYVDKSAVTQRPRRGGYRAAEPAVEGFTKNQLWCEIVALACELLVWSQMLGLAGTGRRREPKRLRLRLFVSRADSRAADASCGCASPNDGRGPAKSSPRSPACKPSPPGNEPNSYCDQGRRTPGPVEPRSPGATAGQPDAASR